MENHKRRSKHVGSINKKKFRPNITGHRKIDESIDFRKLLDKHYKKKAIK